MLAVGWWLWEPGGIGLTVFNAPAHWGIWKAGQSTAAPSSQTLTGQASVIDGDTIEIHGERIRLLDIDAPESHQTCKAADGSAYRCGQKAARAVDDWISARVVTCATAKLDRYKRHLAACTVGGEDLAVWLARNGWAVPYRDCTCAAIREAAARARAERRGLWAGAFVLPWDWRKGER